MPGEFTGGEIEIPRGDLAGPAVRADRGHVRVRLRRLHHLADRDRPTACTSPSSAPRRAPSTWWWGRTASTPTCGGWRSAPRRSTCASSATTTRWPRLDAGRRRGMMYNEPGRMVALGGPKAPAFFVFASEPLDYDRYDVEQQKRILLDAYRGGGWRIPEVLARVAQAPDVYLDSISRVGVDRYAEGRVVLLGDAAYGNTLGGFGTGLAVVGRVRAGGRAGGGARRPPGRRSPATRARSAAMRRWPGRAAPARSSRPARARGSRCATGCSNAGCCSAGCSG